MYTGNDSVVQQDGGKYATTKLQHNSYMHNIMEGVLQCCHTATFQLHYSHYKGG